MMGKAGKVLYPIALMVVVVAVGTLGYVLIEDMRPFEAFYMTVITISTVGFGEVKPLSDVGRAWTILVILFGWGTISVLITRIFGAVVEREFLQIFRMRRIRMRRMKEHFIVCGFGRMGRKAAEFLAKSGRDFVVIDIKGDRVQAAMEMGYNAIEGDATEEETLKRAGVERAKGLAALLDSDHANLYVVLNAKSLNPRLFVVATALTEKGGKLIRKAGADRVILPFEWAGMRIGRFLVQPVVSEFLDVYQMRIEEIVLREGSPFVGRSLKDLSLSRRYGVYVIAIVRGDEVILPPDPDLPLKEGDVLLVIGKTENLKKVEGLAA